MKILAYTSPARGHIYPLVPTFRELQGRGHGVAVRTLTSEVQRLVDGGLAAAPIDTAIEAREIDDWRARTPVGALLAACRTFADRGSLEIEDLRRAVEDEDPDFLLVDVNAWGASAVAEMSGLPWAVFAPYFLPVRAPGVPPWGLGLAPINGPFGGRFPTFG